MTTIEAIEDAFANHEGYASFQITSKAVTTPKEEIFINSRKESAKQAEGRINKMFGKDQDWVCVKIHGLVTFYCPQAVSEELRENKSRMLRDVIAVDV